MLKIHIEADLVVSAPPEKLSGLVAALVRKLGGTPKEPSVQVLARRTGASTLLEKFGATARVDGARIETEVTPDENLAEK